MSGLEVSFHAGIKQAPLTFRQIMRALGPGLVTGAADDDPSGIATYSQAGAQFGFGLLWTVFLYDALHGRDLNGQCLHRARHWKRNRRKPQGPSASVHRVHADFVAARSKHLQHRGRHRRDGEALFLVVGGLKHEHALIFAGSSVLLQIFVPYRRYARYLKWLTLVLFCYVGVIFTVDIPWRDVATSTFFPSLQMSSDYLLMIVALIGTTISPYLFFWQASQEVEEMALGRAKGPLKNLRRGGNPELKKIAVDTSIGMIFSNTIAFFIVLTTAVTLQRA